jgi:hypothetical protein
MVRVHLVIAEHSSLEPESLALVSLLLTQMFRWLWVRYLVLLQ